MNRTLVIAEPGGTAQGDYAAFVRLIHAAKDAGADVFKAQFCSNVDQMMARRNITPEHEAYDFYKMAYGWLSFPVEWHADFARICKDVGIAYACSVYLPQDVETLAPHVEYLKISSFEAHDKELRERAVLAKAGGKYPQSGVFSSNVVISFGMTGELPELRVWSGGKCYAPRWTLHCTTAYPAPLSALNLSLCSGNGQYDGEARFDGFSDHSRNLLTGAVAVGAGARILETHFRLHDCSPHNPDYAVAFNPDELKTYVGNVRQAEEMMGSGIKEMQECERWALPYRVSA